MKDSANAIGKTSLQVLIETPTVNTECHEIACKNICTFYQIFIQKFGSRVIHNSPNNATEDPTDGSINLCNNELVEI